MLTIVVKYRLMEIEIGRTDYFVARVRSDLISHIRFTEDFRRLYSSSNS